MADSPDFLRHYLHVPVRDAQTLQSLVDKHQRESEQLDFKRALDSVEQFAERIAAFANHRGGDIVLGIEEKNDQADRWSPVPSSAMPNTMQQIAQAREFIRPREFASLIETTEILAPTLDLWAIVVSVPPSPEVVAVEARRRLAFPIRVGTHTDHLSYEDVMLRTSVAVRATYIKLCGLRNRISGRIPVSFSSSVIGLVGNTERLPVIARTGSHSFLVSLSSEVLTLDMKSAKLINQYYFMDESCSGLLLTIPLELIRAAWQAPRDASVPMICLALDAEIVLHGQTWILET